MTSPLPTWAEQLRALEGIVDHLVPKWRPDGATEAEMQDMNKLALSMVSEAYLCRVYTDTKRPVFMPLWNYAFNQGGPDPDFVYSTVEMDATGTYVISGFRGTSRFVEITQQGFDYLSPAMRGPGSGTKAINRTLDLDDLTLGDDGRFSVTLSPTRPDGYDGDWWELDDGCRRLLMRRCSCDWTNEVDARVAIDRTDDRGADMTPEEIARRFSDIDAWVKGVIEFDMDLVRYYREHHGVNQFKISERMMSQGSGALPRQAYYDGIHEIDDDEALILESPIPDTWRYFQALVADDRFCTVDWVNRQSSLNDTQARIDSDGRFRCVISRLDPGVPNWLDKGDYPWGIVQMRWNLASEYPDPTMIKVPFAEVRDHLPSDTPVVTPDERAEALRVRREGAQLRRIW
jgi:hypothetical protein